MSRSRRELDQLHQPVAVYHLPRCRREVDAQLECARIDLSGPAAVRGYVLQKTRETAFHAGTAGLEGALQRLGVSEQKVCRRGRVDELCHGELGLPTELLVARRGGEILHRRRPQEVALAKPVEAGIGFPGWIGEPRIGLGRNRPRGRRAEGTSGDGGTDLRETCCKAQRRAGQECGIACQPLAEPGEGRTERHRVCRRSEPCVGLGNAVPRLLLGIFAHLAPRPLTSNRRSSPAAIVAPPAPSRSLIASPTATSLAGGEGHPTCEVRSHCPFILRLPVGKNKCRAYDKVAALGVGGRAASSSNSGRQALRSASLPMKSPR